jgi:hypothetical protein
MGGKCDARGVCDRAERGDLALAARLSRQSLDRTPDDPDLLRLLLVTQLGLQDIEGAQGTAERLDAHGAFAGHARRADLGTAGGGPCGLRPRPRGAWRGRGRVPVWALEAARARIALHQGDLSAARAILVRGIERTPEATPLRTLMLEVLVADGDAAHARDVTSRLGQVATAPGPEIFAKQTDAPPGMAQPGGA